MPSIDVILEQPEIVALGGPTSIELQLDTGATGQRGSLIYIGAGLPSSSTIPNYSSILPGDTYINVASGANYSWLYQYLVKPGGNTWEPITQLNPSPYASVHLVAFTAGTATISIPLSNITSNYSTLTYDKFAINLAFENDNPVAFSITSKSISSSNLVFTVKAIEYNGTSWTSYVDAAANVSVFVRVISNVA